MANYQFSRDIREDVLFRANEEPDNSTFTDAVLRYMNRVYRAILLGGGEYVSGLNEHWWWLRKSQAGVLTLVPRIVLGTVSVTQGSTLVEFSEVLAGTVYTDRYLRADDIPDVFRIASHVADTTTATLDSGYTGLTNTAVSYELWKLDYTLASDVLRLTEPMFVAQGRRAHHGHGHRGPKINRLDLSDILMRFPPQTAQGGIPAFFAEIQERVVRFSHYGGREPDEFARIDYNYSAFPPDLTLDDARTEEPVMPLERRHLLADGALFWLYKDKEDTRATDVGQSLQSGLRNMADEHRFRQITAGRQTGHVFPRGSADHDHVPHTESFRR